MLLLLNCEQKEFLIDFRLENELNSLRVVNNLSLLILIFKNSLIERKNFSSTKDVLNICSIELISPIFRNHHLRLSMFFCCCWQHLTATIINFKILIFVFVFTKSSRSNFRHVKIDPIYLFLDRPDKKL